MSVVGASAGSAGLGSGLSAPTDLRLEALLDGDDGASRAALLALEEVEARLLDERGRLRLAGVAHHVLLCHTQHTSHTFCLHVTRYTNECRAIAQLHALWNIAL